LRCGVALTLALLVWRRQSAWRWAAVGLLLAQAAGAVWGNSAFGSAPPAPASFFEPAARDYEPQSVASCLFCLVLAAVLALLKTRGRPGEGPTPSST
jgi:hypothetical protein